MSDGIRQTASPFAAPTTIQHRLHGKSDMNIRFGDALERLERAELKIGSGEDEPFRRTQTLRVEFSPVSTEIPNEPGMPARNGQDETGERPDGAPLLAPFVKAEQASPAKKITLASTSESTPEQDIASAIDEGTDAGPDLSGENPAKNPARPGTDGKGHQGYLPLSYPGGGHVPENGVTKTGPNTDIGNRSPASAADILGRGDTEGLTPQIKDEGAGHAERTPGRVAQGRGINESSQFRQQTFPDAKPLVEADGKVKILSVHTAPAPAAAIPSTLGATSAALVETVMSDAAWRSSLAAAMTAIGQAGPRIGDPVHSMKLQLHPAELGMVTARLRMVGDHLAIELQVDGDDARQRLAADNDAMVKAMRVLGYDIDRITIQQSQPSTPSNFNAGSAGRENFQQSGSGADGGGERSFGARQERQEGGDGQGGTRRQNHNVPGRNGLYI